MQLLYRDYKRQKGLLFKDPTDALSRGPGYSASTDNRRMYVYV